MAAAAAGVVVLVSAIFTFITITDAALNITAAALGNGNRFAPVSTSPSARTRTARSST